MAKYRLDDFDEWIRPYVIKKTMIRNKNQYNKEKIDLDYFAINVIPIKEMILHKVGNYKKWIVSGICTKCGKNFTIPWNNLCLREKHSKEEFCGKCLRKEVYSDEWRKNNSEAQKKAQGTIDAKKRMSEILIQKHKDCPEIREKISLSLKEKYKNNPELRNKISEASKRNWNNPEYEKKVTGKSFYNGTYLSKYGEIYFASSWELFFLDWCECNKNISSVKRCSDKIDYINSKGGHSRYFPDFEIVLDNKIYVFEIKGRINLIEIKNKQNAAINFFKNQKSYSILYKDDLKRLGINFSKNQMLDKIYSLIGKIKDGKLGKIKLEDYLKNKGYYFENKENNNI